MGANLDTVLFSFANSLHHRDRVTLNWLVHADGHKASDLVWVYDCTYPLSFVSRSSKHIKILCIVSGVGINNVPTHPWKPHATLA